MPFCCLIMCLCAVILVMGEDNLFGHIIAGACTIMLCVANVCIQSFQIEIITVASPGEHVKKWTSRAYVLKRLANGVCMFVALMLYEVVGGVNCYLLIGGFLGLWGLALITSYWYIEALPWQRTRNGFGARSNKTKLTNDQQDQMQAASSLKMTRRVSVMRPKSKENNEGPRKIVEAAAPAPAPRSSQSSNDSQASDDSFWGGNRNREEQETAPAAATLSGAAKRKQSIRQSFAASGRQSQFGTAVRKSVVGRKSIAARRSVFDAALMAKAAAEHATENV